MTRTSSKLLSTGLVALMAISTSATATAQTATSATSVAQGRPLAAMGSLGDLFRGSPGTGDGSPTAFGAGMGDIFVGASYYNTQRRTKLPSGQWLAGDLSSDGVVAGGFGIGDAVDGIGLSVVIAHVGPFQDEAFTGTSLQLFRYIDPTLAIAVGAENALRAGGGDFDGTYYAAVSKIFSTPISQAAWLKSITVNAGVGNGRFRTLNQIMNDDSVVMPFGSVGVLVHEQASAIVDWTGQDLNVGATVVPFKRFPITLTPMVTELLGRANSSVRFVMNFGLGYHF